MENPYYLDLKEKLYIEELSYRCWNILINYRQFQLDWNGLLPILLRSKILESRN